MSETLTHHGILGMRWGFRRTKAQLEKARGKLSSDNESSKKKKVSELTDEELLDKIKRLELEKRYRDLLKDLVPQKSVPQKSSKGKDFVVKVLERSGENIATQASAYVMGKAVNKLFNKIYKDPMAIDPKNIQKKK